MQYYASAAWSSRTPNPDYITTPALDQALTLPHLVGARRQRLHYHRRHLVHEPVRLSAASRQTPVSRWPLHCTAACWPGIFASILCTKQPSTAV